MNPPHRPHELAQCGYGKDRVAAVTRDGRLWSPALRLSTLGLILTITLVAIEALAVITILPLVSQDLGNMALYGWVVSAFSLGTLVGIVIGGEQSDRLGPAAPFAAGLGLFAIGLVLGGVAPTMPALVLARGFQGVGAGAISAVSYASIGRLYPEGSQPRMFAVLSTAWVVPGLVGPGAAAFVAVHLGWRWVFLGLVPLVLGAGLMTVISLRPIGGSGTSSRATGAVLDAARISAGAGLLVGGLQVRPTPLGAVLAAAGVAVGARSLCRRLPRGTGRAQPGLPSAVLARGLLTFAFFGAETYVPLALTSVRGQSFAVAGTAVTATTVSWAAGACFQARQAGRWSARSQIRTGFGLLVAGIGGVSLVLLDAIPIPMPLAGWTVAGLGMGIAYAQISVMVLQGADEGREGASAAAMQLSETLGIALGTGLCGACVAAGSAAGWTPRPGVALAFGVAAALGVLGFWVSGRLTDSRGDRGKHPCETSRAHLLE